jgi:hypothetical protein
MVTREVCRLCDKLIYGKQKCIRRRECELLFHGTCMSECNVDADTGKSTYACDSCVSSKEPAKVNNVESLSESSASPVRYNNSLSVQIEAVRLNGVSTMEMVR